MKEFLGKASQESELTARGEGKAAKRSLKERESSSPRTIIGIFRARGSEDAQRDVGRSLQAACFRWDEEKINGCALLIAL